MWLIVWQQGFVFAIHGHHIIELIGWETGSLNSTLSSTITVSRGQCHRCRGRRQCRFVRWISGRDCYVSVVIHRLMSSHSSPRNIVNWRVGIRSTWPLYWGYLKMLGQPTSPMKPFSFHTRTESDAISGCRSVFPPIIKLRPNYDHCDSFEHFFLCDKIYFFSFSPI